MANEEAPKPIVAETGFKPTSKAKLTKHILIPFDKLEVPQPKKEERDFTLAAAQSLAVSIDTEGLTHPILVRPHPNPEKAAAGMFQLIAGRHRAYACKKILGWDSIPAYVRDDFDDDLLRMAHHSENLFRSNLTRPQFFMALEEWRRLYNKRVRPQVEEAKAKIREERAATEKAQEKAAKAEAKATGQEPPAPTEPKKKGSKPLPENAPRANFLDALAQMMGQSRSSAIRNSRIGRVLGALPPESQQLIVEKNPTAKELLAFSKLDKAHMNACLKAVQGGAAFPDALKAQKTKHKEAQVAKDKAAGKPVAE